MQFFGKIWQNRMLAPLLEGWRPHLGEILDPPLITQTCLIESTVTVIGYSVDFTNTFVNYQNLMSSSWTAVQELLYHLITN